MFVVSSEKDSPLIISTFKHNFGIG